MIDQMLAKTEMKASLPRKAKAKKQCKMALKQHMTIHKRGHPRTYAGNSAIVKRNIDK